MYREHHLLETPPDDAKLWRYVDLSHFLSFLSRRSLYFAKLTEFDDAWEGAISEGVKEGYKRALLHSIEKMAPKTAPASEKLIAMEISKPVAEGFAELHAGVRKAIYGINCWHSNDVESVAMWKLYTRGKDGVAIQTTVSGLKSCLSHESRDIFIARVHYSDHEILPTKKELISTHRMIPIVTKRRSYAHESEVRVILNRRQNKRELEEIERKIMLMEEKTLEELDGLEELEGLRVTTSGESITVDICNLVERVVVSPDYPTWAIADLQERVTAAGLAVTVEKSDLLRKPSIAIEI